jgi:hypothetical protein
MRTFFSSSRPLASRLVLDLMMAGRDVSPGWGIRFATDLICRYDRGRSRRRQSTMSHLGVERRWTGCWAVRFVQRLRGGRPRYAQG